MQEELVAPTATETVAPAEPAVAEQNTTEGVQTPEAKPEKSAEQKELEYLRRKATKADRNNARLYQESQDYKTRLEQLERSRPAEQRQKVEVDPEEVQRFIGTKAQEIAKQTRIAEKCTTIVEQGRKAFTDFDGAVAQVGTDLTLFGNDGNPTHALEAIMDADDPAALLHYLGKNPDVAGDLTDLSPTQLARRLVKIESEIKQPPRPSAAPKPIEPEKSGSSSDMPDPARDPQGYIKYRNEQEKAKRKR